ncbi:MAG: pyruvate kinase [Actinomycetia bacterium]|nr:pyruvate kinase [Actinomycetes bacterium]
MSRRTKIIATIGPACTDAATLKEMIHAGMDVARINTSHGRLEDHLETQDRIRGIAADIGKPIGILADLPGPKVRTAPFPKGGVHLGDGEHITLTAGNNKSTAEVIEVDYETLVLDMRPGDKLAFGDGQVVATIDGKTADALTARVNFGGLLQGRKGLHIPSDRLRVTAPTETDLRYLDAFVEHNVDMVALSFARSAHDIRRLGVEPAPRGPLVVAKIETRAAVENLEGIIDAAGAVMVARGDLGAECPIEEIPHLQKQIISECIAQGRPAITATQMLESMISSPTPTRAEASDVANAVFDGSSAVMLSGETAVGVDPVNTVHIMARICERADAEFDYDQWAERITEIRAAARLDVHPTDRTADAITHAAWEVSRQLDAAAIICVSNTGYTVRSIARFRPGTAILGFSPDERTVKQLSLSWGVEPIHQPDRATSYEMVQDALHSARDAHALRSGDAVVVVSGQSTATRATDTLRVMTIP